MAETDPLDQTAHPPPETDPVVVADMMLRVTEAAYFSGDFETFATWFHLPQTVGTFDGDRRLETEADLRAVFDAMLAHFKAVGVIALRRKVLAARFIAPTVVEATFAAQYILRGHVLSEETVGHGHLRYVEGQWKIAESHYASPDPEITRALMEEHQAGQS